jgi:hypothetical protein
VETQKQGCFESKLKLTIRDESTAPGQLVLA